MRRMCMLAVGLVASSIGVAAHAESIQKCRSRTGEVLFTSGGCPEGHLLVRQHVIESAEPELEAELDAEASLDLDALPPPAAKPPPEEMPGMMARAVVAARFARALSELSTLKTYAMMHMVETGEWPRGPEDLGLDPDTFDTEDISSIEFGRDGAIIANLRPDFGSERKIWLRPVSSLGGATTRWQCETNVQIGTVLPALGVSCEPIG